MHNCERKSWEENKKPEINNNEELDENDPERSVSNQEIIDALETHIAKLEADDWHPNQVRNTVILICKILSVELNKVIPEENDKIINIYV
jgi:hypothetical protein